MKHDFSLSLFCVSLRFSLTGCFSFSETSVFNQFSSVLLPWITPLWPFLVYLDLQIKGKWRMGLWGRGQEEEHHPLGKTWGGWWRLRLFLWRASSCCSWGGNEWEFLLEEVDLQLHLLALCCSLPQSLLHIPCSSVPNLVRFIGWGLLGTGLEAA